MRKFRTSGAGFTLLEIMISIGILAIGMVSVFSLFPIGIYAVRDTVEGTRSASAGRTARAEMAAMRADLAVTASGSYYYSGTHVPFGPWEMPGHMWTWRDCLYQYVDTSASPGVLHNRVLFDDTRMVPIRVRGTFSGGNRVILDPASLTRDSDLLEYYYMYDSAATPPNEYAPWEIALRVRGTEYLIEDRGYIGTDLDWIDVEAAGPALPDDGSGGPIDLPFEILIPVALKEPPMNSPLAYTGGMADFDGTAGAQPIASDLENRNLAHFLVTGGWVRVRQANASGRLYWDWFQLAGRNPNPIAMPSTMTLGGGYQPSAGNAVPFEILLPVVTFDSSDVDLVNGTQRLPLLSALGGTAGGGAHLGYLESGAWVEVVLDGGLGMFVPAKPSPPFAAGIARTTVLDFSNTNGDTDDFIRAGNFIRIDGRDYEIAGSLYDADGDTINDDFDLVGTVPCYGAERYFNIVLGYDSTAAAPTEMPRVARFPVRRVTRTPTVTSPVAYPVTSFEVGRDANGNLPVDLWPAGAPDPFDNPVSIVPANNSSFAYQAVLSQRSPSGDFTNGSSTVDGPSWVQDPTTNALGPIPFSSLINPNHGGLNGVTSVYELRTLTLPDATGGYRRYDIAGSAADYSTLTTGGNANFDAARLPFHAYDRNDFNGSAAGAAIAVGQGTFSAAGPPAVNSVAMSAPSSANAIFLANNVIVQITDAGGPNFYQVINVDPSLDWFQILDFLGVGYPADGAVTVEIAATGACSGQVNRPRGRGNFVEGSDVVTAIYSDQAGSFADVPGRGLPYALTAPERYHLAVGDYIRAPDNEYYAVKAIHDDGGVDFLILDRPYTGTTSADLTRGDYFEYVTPMSEAYTAQIAVFRNYEITALRDVAGNRDLAATFGMGVGYNEVQLAVALPPQFKPGDYIRADGDSDHPSGTVVEPGLNGDAIDGDRCWYMIDAISADRLTLILTSPYRGYIDTTRRQPASVTGSIRGTYDTVLGAF